MPSEAILIQQHLNDSFSKNLCAPLQRSQGGGGTLSGTPGIAREEEALLICHACSRKAVLPACFLSAQAVACFPTSTWQLL